MRTLTHWLDGFSSAEQLDILKDLALWCCREAGPKGDDLAVLVRKDRYRDIVRFEIDYEQVTIREARYLRQALAFFTKAEFLDIGVDKQQVAHSQFLAYETLCRETNARFRLWSSGRIQFRPAVEAVLHMASRKIADVLGDVPSFSELKYRFGPGATTLTKKREASLRRKLGAGLSCSEELLPRAARLLAEMPHLALLHAKKVTLDLDAFDGKLREIGIDPSSEWGEILIEDERRRVRECEWTQRTESNLPYWWQASEDPVASIPVEIQPGVLSFVPKNAKTYRSVVTEPVLNGLYQLALGDHMTKRLMRSGLDLSDQTINQGLAMLGSLTGALATLDLSGASDTISQELVAHLLPIDWYTALKGGRTGKVTTPGSPEPLVLEKFSSMGNGYTFPLESLIFWALAYTTTSATYPQGCKCVSVYGDDIIVPTQSVPLLREVLDVCGFVVNGDKSYWAGPFRESCGADYLSGIDIRPIYVKEDLTVAGLFTLHNGLCRKGEYALARVVRKLIPPALVTYGPDGFGDGHLLDSDAEGEPSMRGMTPHNRRSGYEGHTFNTYQRVQKKDFRSSSKGDYVLPHYISYTRSSGDLIAARSLLDNTWVRTPGGDHARASGGTSPSDYAIKMRINSVSIEEPSLALPWVTNEDGVTVKATTFPGFDGYKKVRIYTLR